MSQENVDLARAVLETLGRRDADRLVELSDPEVEWRSFFALAEKGAYRGHEGTRRYMRDLTDAFDVGEPEVDDALGLGDIAVLVGRIHYRGAGSGAEGASAAGWVLRFRRGKVLSFRAFRDPVQALAAVGLEE